MLIGSLVKALGYIQLKHFAEKFKAKMSRDKTVNGL